MRIALAKNDNRATIGEGDKQIVYYYRAFTIEEMTRFRARAAWDSDTVEKIDMVDVIRAGVTKIEGLEDGNGDSIDTIEKLLSLKTNDSVLNNIVLVMFAEIWSNQTVREELKKG